MVVTLPCSRSRHESCGYRLDLYRLSGSQMLVGYAARNPILIGVTHCACPCHDLGLFGADA